MQMQTTNPAFGFEGSQAELPSFFKPEQPFQGIDKITGVLNPDEKDQRYFDYYTFSFYATPQGLGDLYNHLMEAGPENTPRKARMSIYPNGIAIVSEDREAFHQFLQDQYKTRYGQLEPVQFWLYRYPNNDEIGISVNKSSAPHIRTATTFLINTWPKGGRNVTINLYADIDGRVITSYTLDELTDHTDLLDNLKFDHI